MPRKSTTPKRKMRPRGASEKARDLKVIASLYKKGWKQTDIADKLGLSVSTICTDIKKLQKRWLKDADVDFDTQRIIALARLDDLYKEHWEAWDRSIQPIEKNGETVYPPGRQSHLESARKCVVESCKLQGLYETNVKISGDRDNPLVVEGVDAQETLLSRLLEVASEADADEVDK